MLFRSLMGPLQQAKLHGQQVFLRTDTHWTPDGAEIAAKQLAKAIADKTPLSGEPQRFVTEAEKTEPHKGDLRLFLPLDPLFENLMPPQEPLQKRVTHAVPTKAEGDDALFADRSEERRVGKECRGRWQPERYKKQSGVAAQD